MASIFGRWSLGFVFCWRVRSIWSTLELRSSSVLPICFVAADSDAPAPAAIEISASFAYRPTSPKILKLSRGVRQAGHVRDQLARRSRRLPVSIDISDVAFC